MIEYSRDELWKAIIEDLFDDFMSYFYPSSFLQLIDFEKGYEFLDKELAEIITESDSGNKYVDKLVKLYLKDGQEQWFLIHIEVQGYQEKDFAARMFTYFYRLRERWKKDVLSLVILTDDKKSFHPKRYEYEFYKTKLIYEFDTFKVINKTDAELYKANNPFSIVMLTTKRAIEQPKSTAFTWKMELVRQLQQANYNRKTIGHILHFVRYYVKFNTSQEYDNFIKETLETFKIQTTMGMEELITRKVTEYVTQKVTNEITQKVTNEITQKVTNEITQKVTNEVTQKVTNELKQEGIKKALLKGLDIATIADLFEVSEETVRNIQSNTI
jgi:hypothetical protein